MESMSVSHSRSSGRLALCVTSVLSFFVGASPIRAMPLEWNCSNRELREISCSGNGCTFQDRFTPMVANWNQSSNKFGIGVYESYFQGTASSRQHGQYIVVQADGLISHPDIQGSTMKEESRRAILTIDTKAGFGVLAWESYFMPLRCVTSSR